jgi:hypothetical protein
MRLPRKQQLVLERQQTCLRLRKILLKAMISGPEVALKLCDELFGSLSSYARGVNEFVRGLFDTT